MIQQPELGKKIADFRKSKGFTQEELVERCNLSVRTLQRIEAGEVTPRIYTIKLILEVLELEFENFLNSQNENNRSIEKWFEQFYISFIDSFNLKTNKIKKVSILSAALFAIIFGISSITNVPFGQSNSKVKKIIKLKNMEFVQNFNKGNIDSLLEMYNDNACILPRGCGKEFIKNYYLGMNHAFEFSEMEATSIKVKDSVAIEKGKWKAVMHNGIPMEGEYSAEWRLIDDKWLIITESSGFTLE